MLLNKKYIIGTHVMFYEVEMISEFVNSVYKAVNQVDNKDNITVDFLFNSSISPITCFTTKSDLIFPVNIP